MKKKESFRVLLAPLDWGLGHATRCIPLIKLLLLCKCHVIIACNSVAKRIFESEFPDIEILPLQGYDIKYAASKWKFTLKIAIQIPKILGRIKQENQWLQSMVSDHDIDLIISDNRYGFYHKKVPSVFITHQLQIQTPGKWITHFIQQLNYRFINRFSECWVPDYPATINLGGKLSHPKKLPSIPVHYIGPLSRFSNHKLEEKKYKWMIILSGPEPQRSVLEKRLLQVVNSIKEPVLFIRGLPNATDYLQVSDHCTVYNHLPTSEMQQAFQESEYIISRSGYTTVMEIIALQKKSILIPTPGQTEQEYLALHLHNQQWCYTCLQEEDILHHLDAAQQFAYVIPSFTPFALHAFIKNRIENIKAGI